MLTDEDKEKVRNATDIAELVAETVVLRPRGSDLWGCCPFHQEKSPSFHVVPSRGLWKCFGCGRGGDCFSFVMERDHVDFPDAVRILADRAGVTLSDDGRSPRGSSGSGAAHRSRLYQAMDAAVQFYHRQLTRVRSPQADQARSYLAGRGFGSNVAAEWCLGFAPGRGALLTELSSQGFTRKELVDARLLTQREGGEPRDAFYNRVMFPIRDERGRVVALGGRVMDDGKPKYINSADSPIYSKTRTLFALDKAKAYITAQMEVVIEEGYTDVISTHLAGIRNAVAPLGTSLTAQHVKMLSRYLTSPGDRVSRGRIICLFDGDAAGLRAAERALSFCNLTSAQMYCVVLPGGMDPAEFLAAQGADAMRDLLSRPVALARFVVDRHLERFDLLSPEGRANALADVVSAMGPLKGGPLAGQYVRHVAGRLGVDPQTVSAALSQVRWVLPSEGALERDLAGGEGQELLPDTSDRGPSSADDADWPTEGRRRAAGAAQAAPLLPEDARAVRLEHEVLSTISGCVDAARSYEEVLSQVVWADPRNQAVCWAMLALPAGATPMQALAAAEQAEPDAAQILADGTSQLVGDADGHRALGILVGELQILSLRRQVRRATERLRASTAAGTAQVGDVQEYDSLFTEVVQLQRRLQELEMRQREAF